MKISELAVHNNIATWVGIILLLLIGMVALSSMPLDLFPEINYPTAVVVTEYSGATPEEVMNSVTKLLEEALSTVDHVKSVSSISQPGMSTVMVELDWGTDTSYAALQMRERIDGLEKYLPPEAGKPQLLETDLSDLPVMQVGVAAEGLSLSALKTLADDLIKPALERVPGTRGVKASVNQGLPQLSVILDHDKLSFYSLNSAMVAQTVHIAMEGQTATRLRRGDRETDVLVRLDEQYRNSASDLESLLVTTATGSTIPLKEVARIKRTQGPSDIARHEQQRAVYVSAELQGRDLGSVAQDIKAGLAGLNIPAGYTIQVEGEYDQMQDTFSELGKTLLLALVLVYLLLAVQFNSWHEPLVIMFSVPLVVPGAVLGLVLLGSTLNIASFIGLIMLAGIVVNNAIVLVDYVKTLRGAKGVRQERHHYQGRYDPLAAHPDDHLHYCIRDAAHGPGHGRGERGERLPGDCGGWRSPVVDHGDAGAAPGRL